MNDSPVVMKIKIYRNLRYSSYLLIIAGLIGTLLHEAMGPILIALSILFITINFSKTKKHDKTFYSSIIVTALSIMVILEYFLVPIQNKIFYTILLIMSIGIFINFYFSLKPQNLLTQREKILSCTGTTLFGITLFSLMGIIYDNFILSIILGALVLIMFIIIRLIREKTFKDNEFNETYTTKRDEREYWFKYEIGGFPKPVRWQGWAGYGIISLFFLIVLIFVNDPTTAVVILVASIFIAIIMAILKSNFRESVREYRENLKK